MDSLELTLFGLPGALSEEQLVLLVWQRHGKDSGHQWTVGHIRLEVLV